MDRAAFQNLLADLDVEDWLDTEGIDFRRGAAGQFQLKDCPFCGDGRWKVYMRADDGRGTCFHGDCQKGFNLFSFARQHLGADDRATFIHFETYARGAGMLASAPKVRPAPVTPDDWSLPSSIELPTPTGQTLPYLIERKITLGTQALFGLRYCHSGVYRYADLEGAPRMMDFSQRILMPVEDLDGVIKTFQGRDVSGESEKRYLFPPFLPGTGRFLYAACRARGKEHLVIGEGPFDVMAIHQSIEGMPEFRDTAAIGSFGLSIGHGHETGDDQLGRFRILRREGLKTLTFLWDGEAGALKQAVKMGSMLKGEGFTVRIGLLPADKDPAECSTEEVRNAIREAQVLTGLVEMQLTLRPPYT